MLPPQPQLSLPTPKYLTFQGSSVPFRRRSAAIGTLMNTRGLTELVLLSIGRAPRLDDLGLDSVGLTPDDVTGGRLPEWLHAVGDVDEINQRAMEALGK